MDRVRDVIHHLNTDGFDSLYPKYEDGRPKTSRSPGVVDGISHEGLRTLLRAGGVSFQRLKTWNTSRDPDYAAKKGRVEHLYAIAGGKGGEPDVMCCMVEFGPLNLLPHPGRQWTDRGGMHMDPDREPRRRRRANYNRESRI